LRKPLGIWQLSPFFKNFPLPPQPLKVPILTIVKLLDKQGIHGIIIEERYGGVPL
jgi:hypothetical protein